MTNPTPHGQVPEALRLAHIFDNPLPPEWPDMVAAAAELRRQHTRIAELEAVGAGEVQALSAAPAAKKSALRTYPNPIVPLIKPVSEQEKMRALYLASSNLMAYLGRNGAIHSDGHAADAMMDCLNDLDGGGFDETLFAASPTPPAEQQAAPKAAPGVVNSVFDHQTAADFLSGKTVSDEAVRKFVATSRWAHDERAALSAKLLAMHGVLTSREAEIALLKKALLEAETAPQPAPDCHHRPPCDECAALAAQGGKV